ncbi:MAG: hypothetical protein Q9227_002844 [Pyrenula ochraceoflavens]
MRPSARVTAQVERRLSNLSHTPYICRSCQRLLQQQPRQHQIFSQARYASSLSERLRGALGRGKQSEDGRIPASAPPTGSGGEEDSAVQASSLAINPASTWKDLQWVGSDGRWTDQPEKSTDRHLVFTQEIRRTKMKDPDWLLTAIHRAAVEIVTLQSTGQDMDNACRLIIAESETETAINQTRISATPQGAVKLKYPNEQAKKMILESLEEPPDLDTEAEQSDATEPAEADTSAVADEQVQQSSETIDERMARQTGESKLLKASKETEEPQPDQHKPQRPTSEKVKSVTLAANQRAGLKKVSLSQPKLKFFLLKRISQLTGHSFPDHDLSSLLTLHDVLQYTTKAANPKPTRVSGHLRAERDLTALKNVRIRKKRHTTVEKERQLGRLKVIEQELEKKGLPAFAKTPRWMRAEEEGRRARELEEPVTAKALR